jgi:hypothetical protein
LAGCLRIELRKLNGFPESNQLADSKKTELLKSNTENKKKYVLNFKNK